MQSFKPRKTPAALMACSLFLMLTGATVTGCGENSGPAFSEYDGGSAQDVSGDKKGHGGKGSGHHSGHNSGHNSDWDSDHDSDRDSDRDSDSDSDRDSDSDSDRDSDRDSDSDSDRDSDRDSDSDWDSDHDSDDPCGGYDNDHDSDSDHHHKSGCGHDSDHDSDSDWDSDHDSDSDSDDRPDSDGDGIPDACDVCEGDNDTGDSDGDGVCDSNDACEGFDDGDDADADGVPDGCEDVGVKYGTSEFVASAAEDWPYMPNNEGDLDSRGGSVEINTNGIAAVGDLANDPAYQAWIMTLRNGAGDELEQIYAERDEITNRYDADGCLVAPLAPFPVCAVWSVDKIVDGATCDDCISLASSAVNGFLSTTLPDLARDSNEGHDDSLNRVTVTGTVTADVGAATGSDNLHETMNLVWEVPEGRVLRDETQLFFRGRYDWMCNGLGGDDSFVDLFRVKKTGVETQDAAVNIISETTTRLEIEINMQAALEAVQATYEADGVDLSASTCP